jgi:hypothetical protein
MGLRLVGGVRQTGPVGGVLRYVDPYIPVAHFCDPGMLNGGVG